MGKQARKQARAQRQERWENSQSGRALTRVIDTVGSLAASKYAQVQVQGTISVGEAQETYSALGLQDKTDDYLTARLLRFHEHVVRASGSVAVRLRAAGIVFNQKLVVASRSGQSLLYTDLWVSPEDTVLPPDCRERDTYIMHGSEQDGLARHKELVYGSMVPAEPDPLLEIHTTFCTLEELRTMNAMNEVALQGAESTVAAFMGNPDELKDSDDITERFIGQEYVRNRERWNSAREMGMVVAGPFELHEFAAEIAQGFPMPTA